MPTYSRREIAILYMPEIVHFESKIANLEAKHEESAKVVLNLQKDKINLLKDFEKVQENTKLLEKENVDLKEKINFGRKMLTESENRIKSCEMKNCQLLKQIYDFEQVLVLERDKFEKERTEFQTERKGFESKSVEFSLKISDLEKILAKEREEFECKKNVFQKENSVFEKKKTEMLNEFSLKINKLEKELEDNFSDERKIFQNEIKKLTKNLSDLSTNFMKEQKVKSDLQKKYDLFFKENNVLINKVKELEDIVFNVDVSKQASPDTIDQTPLANSTESECSFKTASSSIFKNISLNELKRSNDFSKDQIHPSNLFYNSTFDKLDKDLNVSKVNTSSKHKGDVFKRVKMEWRVKGTTTKKKVPKSKVPNSNVKKNNTYQGKSFVKPDVIYSVNQLVRIAQKKLCCSYCGTDDFVNKRYIQHWFGSYRISSYATAPNKPGPKFNWVPKSI